jgi:PAS domain S-box-containing protein
MFMRAQKDLTLTVKLAAIEALQRHVMIADHALRIVHVNASLMALLRAAEPELKRDMPSFNTATLVGSTIDIFHKDPSHQRTMLASLSKPHAAAIRIGDRVFDLLVTPLFDHGARLGYVVEWADGKDRREGLDFAAQIAAIGRSQAVVSFAPDGTIIEANENFLKVVGYTLDEVKGRNHSIFVPAEEQDAGAYRSFWADLRAGQYKAGRFRRVAKDGRSIFIDGAYNPIVDEKGEIFKIVKFVMDVTSQVELLSELTALISGLSAVADESTAQSRQATGAADTASCSVQSIAANADQLASSIAEIAQSMAKSRTATEHAFEQAVNVGSSTEALSQAGQEMNGVVGLIQNITQQINLLALNATIEAARAGDVGKGFAVVASEVKNLAVKAARATEQITGQISGLQTTSAAVAEAVTAIRDSMMTVRENVGATAAAVEEQTAVTRGMSENMQEASSAVMTVSGSIQSIDAEIKKLGEIVRKTQKAAQTLR